MTENREIERIQSILDEVREKGGFLLALLADAEGLPIAASAENGQKPAVTSAAVSLIRQTAGQAMKHLALGEPTEIIAADEKRSRLVMRVFALQHQAVILAVLIPEHTRRYRHVTNGAIRAIQTGAGNHRS